MTDTAPRFSWRRWYEENREDHNARRREAYAQDKKLRQKVRKQVEDYRTERHQGRKVERVYHRQIEGVEYEMFGTCYVADHLGISAQTLINWEKRGLIPKPINYPERHRLYTRQQMNLIGLLVATFKDIPPQRRNNVPEVDQVVEIIHANWRS